jgi:GMP synthase-like glutamine amidotransferase
VVRIAVLDLSYWPAEYMSGQPKFGEELARWMARGLPDAVFTVIDVVEGDPLPQALDFDGYLVSGSDKGVYDDPVWMAPLRMFLLAAKAAGRPLLGVCFGHQIMADVFGGKAEKVGPPIVGVRTFDIDGIKHAAHVWHQDQVTRVPPGASVIARADYCPLAGLAYDFPALSIQFHPEYEAHYMGGFLKRARGNVLENAATDNALGEINAGNVQPDLFAKQAAAFFRTAVPDPG